MTMILMNISSLLTIVTIVLSFICKCPRVDAFSPSRHYNYERQRVSERPSSQLSSSEQVTSAIDSDEAATDATPACYWKKPGGWWEPRLNINDLQVGQNLTGMVFQELLNGTTGPKLFLDCGIGRLDKRGRWQIVTGMLRIGGRGMKESVIRKKAAKIRQKEQGIPIFVSKVYRTSCRVEVVMEWPPPAKTPRRTVSTLTVNEELVGTVVQLENFGAMINVGANRNGLLHIQKVADLYGRFIDKKEGLVEAGLEVGARLRVQVAELNQRRLFLDFTADVRADAAEEQEQKASLLQKQKEARMKALEDRLSGKVVAEETPVETEPEVVMSEEEAAAWGATSGWDTNSDDEEEEDEDDESDYDDEDDDNAIEDALGLGSW